jgi:hypothetical protein
VPTVSSAIALPEPRSKVLPVTAVVSRANREVEMPVEEYAFSRVRTDLDLLSERVKAIEKERHEETMARYEKQRKRTEREMYVLFGVLWAIMVAAWSAIITAAIVGN